MSCKVPECLKELVEVLVTGRVFKKKKMSKDAFKCFVEVLKNAGSKKLKNCFGKSSRKGLRKYKKLVKILTSRRLPQKKRQKKLFNSSRGFRKFIRIIFKDFIRNCVSHADCEESDIQSEQVTTSD